VFVQAYKRVQSERRKKAVFKSIWGTPRARLASVSSVIASKRASIIGDAASVQLAMRSSPNQAAGSRQDSCHALLCSVGEVPEDAPDGAAKPNKPLVQQTSHVASKKILPAHVALKFLTRITHEEESMLSDETDVRHPPSVPTVLRRAWAIRCQANALCAVCRVERRLASTGKP
jgi:hypothetical protein